MTTGQAKVAWPRPLHKALSWRALGAAFLLIALMGANTIYLRVLDRQHGIFVFSDFAHNGWLPGRVVLGGGSPYHALEWLRANWTPEYEREIGSAWMAGEVKSIVPTRDGAVFNPEAKADFLYPLWLAYLLSPFALLPLFWATAFFMLLSEVALLIALWCGCRIVGFRPPWYVAVILVVLAFGFRPTFVSLQLGTFNILVLAALLGAILSIQRRGPPWVAGLLLSVCTLKLQAALAVLVFVGLWLLAQRRLDVIGWAVGGTAALWGVPTLFYPGWIGDWLAMLGLVSPLIFAQPTLWSLWITYLGPYWQVAGAATTLALAVGLLLYWRRDLRAGSWNSLPVSFIVALPVAYYSWDHDQVLLLFPWLACWALAAVGESARARTWRYVLMLWVLVLPLYSLLQIPRGEQQTYGLLLPASLLLLYIAARRQARAPAAAEQAMSPEPLSHATRGAG